MRRLMLAAAAVLATVGLASCTEADISSADVYKVGCPAVDSAVAGGSMASKATIAGLKALRDSGQLGTEAQAWLVAAIDAIESGKAAEMPAEAKQLIVDGCADNGYPLRNLK